MENFKSVKIYNCWTKYEILIMNAHALHIDFFFHTRFNKVKLEILKK